MTRASRDSLDRFQLICIFFFVRVEIGGAGSGFILLIDVTFSPESKDRRL